MVGYLHATREHLDNVAAKLGEIRMYGQLARKALECIRKHGNVEHVTTNTIYVLRLQTMTTLLCLVNKHQRMHRQTCKTLLHSWFRVVFDYRIHSLHTNRMLHYTS